MELNTILIILGIIALIGLVGHGVWSNRREKSIYFENANPFNHREAERSTLKNAQVQSAPAFTQPPQGPALQQDSQPVQQHLDFHSQPVQPSAQPQAQFTTSQSAQAVSDIRITLPNVEPSTQHTAPQPSAAPADEPVYYEYRPEKKQPSPNLAERTMEELEHFAETEDGVHFNDEIRVTLQNAAASPISQPKPVEPIQAAETQQQIVEPQATGYVMLYVVAAENRHFNGAVLSQTLDDLGFIFGRDRLYHRHLDLTIASPVIFSVADANQPGTFPYGMHEFSTNGVAVYMQLPSAGNDRANLIMMLQSAKNLAAQLRGFVLTEEGEMLDEKAEANYLARL